MLNMLPFELPCSIPGATSTVQVQPYQQEIITSTEAGTGGATVNVTTIYDRYHDGIVPVIKKNSTTGAEWIATEEQPCEIFKTVTKVSGNTTSITREHAWAKWSDRTTATYYPSCHRIDTNNVGASDRMFR